MPTDNIVNISTFGVLLPFITLIFSVASIVILLDCVWRVEKRLGTAFKLLAASVIIVTIRRALGILGLNESMHWANILTLFDLVSSIFALFGFIEFGKIIRTLTRENQKRE
jgi:hypothetical protein